MADSDKATGKTNGTSSTKAAGTASRSAASKPAARKRAKPKTAAARATPRSTAAKSNGRAKGNAAKPSARAASAPPAYGIATALTGVAGLLVGGLAIWFGRQQIEAATSNLIEQAKTQYAKRTNGAAAPKRSKVLESIDTQRFD